MSSSILTIHGHYADNCGRNGALAKSDPSKEFFASAKNSVHLAIYGPASLPPTLSSTLLPSRLRFAEGSTSTLCAS